MIHSVEDTPIFHAFFYHIAIDFQKRLDKIDFLSKFCSIDLLHFSNHPQQFDQTMI